MAFGKLIDGLRFAPAEGLSPSYEWNHYPVALQAQERDNEQDR